MTRETIHLNGRIFRRKLQPGQEYIPGFGIVTWRPLSKEQTKRVRGARCQA